MSDNVLELRPTRDRAAELVGYVEAMTETAALGWVWQPGQATRVQVELRLGEQVVSRAVAESLREDLRAGGIGDGAHAYTLPVPEALRSRIPELRVFAQLPGGTAVALSSPPAASDGAEQVRRLQRGMDALIGSQRLMHRNLQAVLVQQGPNLANSLAEIASAQGKLEESIATVERFVVRVEQVMHAHETPATPHSRPSLLVWGAIGGSALAMAGSSVALYLTLFHA